MRKMIMILFLASSLFAQKGFEVDKKEHDLMCGLEPYQYPRWVSEIEFKNGKKIHFVSVKCMMLFFYKNSKWDDLGVKNKDDIKSLRVQDYNSLHVIDAKKAYFVFGSKRVSPKGDDLIPFENEEVAKTFMQKSGGKKILMFQDFKLNLFDYLNL